jgi:multiple sugar transport system permease protein
LPNLTGYLLIAPAFFAIFAVLIYPLITAFDLSLHKVVLTDPAAGRPFAGLDNYLAVLAAPYFLNAIVNTLVWTLSNLAIQIVFGLALALLLNASFPGRGLARALLLLPWVIPSVVAMLSWRWMYDAEFGIINMLLMALHIIPAGVAWLGNVGTAMPAVILESIWKGTPFVMVMLLAALQAVPTEIYDAARVDGAGGWGVLRFVTLPLIMPTLTIAATLTTIFTFNNFNAIWLMTQGGPLRATETLTILVYDAGFRDFNLGRASAIGVITFLILLLFVVAFGRHYVKSQVEL